MAISIVQMIFQMFVYLFGWLFIPTTKFTRLHLNGPVSEGIMQFLSFAHQIKSESLFLTHWMLHFKSTVVVFRGRITKIWQVTTVILWDLSVSVTWSSIISIISFTQNLKTQYLLTTVSVEDRVINKTSEGQGKRIPTKSSAVELNRSHIFKCRCVRCGELS